MASGTGKQKKRQYHCLDIWAISNETLSLSDEERKRVIPTLVRLSDGPFEPNSLDQPASITFVEEATAVFLLCVCMGGPLIWIFSTLYALLFGSWTLRTWAMLFYIVLAYHPMPSSAFVHRFITSRYTQALYRYFSYRMVWTDSNLEDAQSNGPWIGAGPPHGVLPFANVLSIPAINSIMGKKFAGAPANIVFRTPFLRYLTGFYPSVPVSRTSIAKTIAKGTSVGLVPDGIAGIFRQNSHVEVVALKHRRGLARHALRHGTTILPAYSFGNTSAFGSWWDRFGLLEWASRKMQASVFIYWGRFGLPIPRRVQITMVFGTLIKVTKVECEPTEEQIQQLHEHILAGIRDCFESHKHALGWGDKELVFE
eukprot:scaffold245331_cov48-Attheya_sp.AAC.4